ncbi:PP2C family protein-serine/threonine phosphatase [Candidatus Neptunochlamydia vexilliferae]|uniref:HAMP domain-containing protein n=1 Tax=Candidatus Neptunichlamydia vexilliferae TaxID=1651774 RepID=A0ABS0B1A1_9BACT|nr:PP2C family protein-serine/threonine phosphatase [Candidatus Neptunochlamydia vexilliferae]MBF5060151.1 hypothetical protein [Candidatus Neptunochlamydia vexilliferae]
MKGSFKGIRGSLASRIILIAMLFMVVPLLALITLLYSEDSRLKKENNYFILRILMDEKVGIITGVVSHDMDLLSAIATLYPLTNDQEGILKKLVAEDDVLALFHLKQGEKGDYVCDLSSSSELKGKDFTQIVSQAKKGVTFVIDPKTEIFYLTYYDWKESGAWTVSFVARHITQDFPIEKDILYAASTSLIDGDGTILLSTNEELKGRHFTRPIGKTFHLEGETYISLERAVPHTNFSLVISAPESVNFVDIPFLILKVAIALILILVIGGGGALLLTKKLSKPLRSLIEVMGKVGKGNLEEHFTPEPMGFEINAIGNIFNETVDSLKENMEAAQKERLEKEAYETELLIGEEVQRSILPKKLPDFPGVSLGARFISAKEVGGDFYDFLPDGKLLLSIADTAGKGISACLYSLSVRSMLRSFGQIHQTLDQAVKETNNLFCEDAGDTGVFVTAFVTAFDPKTKRLEYTNCGHFPPFLLKKSGAVEKLTTPGMALGVEPFEKVATAKKQLESGDLLLFFTDGVVEAHNEAMEMFGEERLMHSFQEKKGESPQEIVNQIVEEVALFAEGCSQHDDLTLVVLKVR